MTTTLWLRSASIIAFLFAAGHGLGGLKQWSPMGENAVLKAMRETRFDKMSVRRSYLDFYLGFGWSLAIAEAMLAVLLWQIAALARTDAGGHRRRGWLRGLRAGPSRPQRRRARQHAAMDRRQLRPCPLRPDRHRSHDGTEANNHDKGAPIRRLPSRASKTS